MLQQILRDMWVDPEILAGLDEEQKQTLFCKMREEQVRRWKLWEEETNQEEENTAKKKSALPRNSKSVSFMHGADGEPWVWVMGEHENDKSIDEILREEAIEKARQLAEQETVELRKQMEAQILSDYIRLNSKIDDIDVIDKDNEKAEDNSQFDIYCSVDELRGKSDDYNKKFQSKKYNTVGSKEILLQKRLSGDLSNQKVKDKITVWEKGLRESRTNEIYHKIQKRRMETAKEAEEAEKKHEPLWQEQERKAKEAEEQIRQIARKARETYKRTSSNLDNIVVYGEFNSAVPPNKDAVIQWYINMERKNNKAGLDEQGNYEPWFHGLITRNEAEKILNDQPEGSFLIRLSERIWGYALSYRAVDKCKHYLISSKEKYRFLGKNHIDHDSLGDLVKYHYIHPLTEGEKLIYVCKRNTDNVLEMLTACRS
ncbi:SH2 domain-containing protein 4A [Agrilus planipennis]|uniref:SH2 domain-containing protein 4A n=1 Tax=Agrilus planipennis TaxID=224129 RepID=A0A1W4WIT5_AGRPL|nr:SH2 domain-containing protein 4A [Agrilus planipennis]